MNTIKEKFAQSIASKTVSKSKKLLTQTHIQIAQSMT